MLRQTTLLKKDTFFAHRKSARFTARSKSEDKETSSSSSRDAKVHRERAERRGERSIRFQKGAKLLSWKTFISFLDFFFKLVREEEEWVLEEEEEEEEERRCSRSRGHRRVAAMLLEV